MRINHWWLCPRCLARELRERVRSLFVVDAVKEARKISKELAMRPFSDKYDESSGGGGYFGAGPAQMQYKRGLCDLAKEIENRPPCPPHPRARREKP